jgi:hypothetical protein
MIETLSEWIADREMHQDYLPSLRILGTELCTIEPVMVNGAVLLERGDHYSYLDLESKDKQTLQPFTPSDYVRDLKRIADDYFEEKLLLEPLIVSRNLGLDMAQFMVGHLEFHFTDNCYLPSGTLDKNRETYIVVGRTDKVIPSIAAFE